MAQGNSGKMQKLRGCLTGLKRRRRSAGSNSSGSGSQRSSADLKIVHVSMEESRRRTMLPPAAAAFKRDTADSSSMPMNYWFNSDSDSDEGDSPGRDGSLASAGSIESPGRDSFVDVIDNDQVSYTPLRSAPKPKARTAPPLSSNSSDKQENFSRGDWRRMTDEAVFGTRRARQEEGDSTAGESDCTEWSTPSAKHNTTKVAADHEVPAPPKAVQQSSSISLRVGQSAYRLCASALNEILFATNAQIDNDLHDMLEDYINGRGLSNLTDDFEAVVDYAYAGFLKAARPILDITDEVSVRPSMSSDGASDTATDDTAPPDIRRYASSRFAGSMESLLAEIVDCYTFRADENRKSHVSGWQTFHDSASPRQSMAIEDQMESYGIDIVKYNKEQLRRYALTGVSKYVSGQVLLSTGIENDLADKLDESAQTLRLVAQQIETLESLVQSKDNVMATRELSGLRKKAIRYRRTVKQLKTDAKDANNIRRIFEMALLEIQLL
ncbi:hypothetical protein GGF46_004142 [Coemansia sp. RSA 552]|nr:hypothetical protein GGF46_004142 [Coemansia sp. RSA 552]